MNSNPAPSSTRTIAEIVAENLAAFDVAETKPRLACTRCGKLDCLDLPWIEQPICEPCWKGIESQHKQQTDAQSYHDRREASRLPRNYYAARYGDFAVCPDPAYTLHQQQVAKRLKEICEHSSKGCLLVGPTGTGKTHLLAAAANTLLLKQAVLWLDPQRLEQELAKSTFDRGKELVEPFGQRVARDYDTVFLDEFTFDKTSYDWLQTSFQRFLNDLTAYGQVRLFVSTNNPLDGVIADPVTKHPARSDGLPSLRSIFKERGISRLVQLMHIVPLVGPNRRLPS